MATRQHPATIARRLRIFAFAKDFMDEHQRSPTVREVMEALDIPEHQSASVHFDFRKLRRADGLPLELRSKADKRETNYRPGEHVLPVDQFDSGLRMRRIAVA